MNQYLLSPPPKNASVCVLSARRFGDAIINARLLKEAALIRPDINWIIWTKPEFKPLFELMGFKNIVTAQFPIAGGAPKFIKGGWIDLIKSILQLRKLNIDISLDFIGDTRESLLGALIGSKKHYSPKWDPGHWMGKLIWQNKVPLVQYLPVTAQDEWVYGFIPKFLSTALGAPLITKVNEEQTNGALSTPTKIAFHPYSSQSFKQWPTQNWISLARLLNKQSISPAIICSSSEAKIAHQDFSHLGQLLTITECISIDSLISEINKIDVLIGVDSFLVHLASALGKKTIVINAGNLPQYWVPPNSQAIGQSGSCNYYPCFNQPKCLGTPNESACIKSISPDQILSAVELGGNIQIGGQ